MAEPQIKILIIDDDEGARLVLRGLVERVGPAAVLEAQSLTGAQAVLAANDIGIALIDLRLGTDARNRDGLTLVREIRTRWSTVPIVVSGAGDMAEVRAAMRAGAYDYILKDDLSEELVLPLLEELREKQALEQEVLRLRSRRCPDVFSGLVGTSPAMQRLREFIQRVATSRRPVLVRGPTGSGKEVVVRCIHALSTHPEQPLIDLNCGAIPATLIESQLFGHEKGAFTGATHRHEGAFAAAGKGTLFLDEIAELPLELQAKLLRALESGEFRPVGAMKNRTFEGRVVAATHADLEAMVRDGKFREDLYYRLNVLQIDVPPLENRREDIPALLAHFLARQERQLHFTREAVEWLQTASWTGNVRQLRNLVDRIAVFVPDARITPEVLVSLPGQVRERVQPTAIVTSFTHALMQLPGEDKLEMAEIAVVEEVLRMTNGNKTEAASLLGVDRRVVERRLRRSLEDGRVRMLRSGSVDKPGAAQEP